MTETGLALCGLWLGVWSRTEAGSWTYHNLDVKADWNEKGKGEMVNKSVIRHFYTFIEVHSTIHSHVLFTHSLTDLLTDGDRAAMQGASRAPRGMWGSAPWELL